MEKSTDDFVIAAIKDHIEELINKDIDEKIEKEVEMFRRRLVDNKEQYVAEVIKGISILHNRDIDTYSMTYKVIFENIMRLEK